MNNQDDALKPYLVLEVANGQTEHRLRPVLNKRYVIGSASTCDLQIGEKDSPPLHSILLIGPDGAEIEAIANEPDLIINGKILDNAILQQGDEIQIGQIKFNVHLTESNGEFKESLQNENHQDHAHIVPFPSLNLSPEINEDKNISELSIEELVDLIDEEEQLIEENESEIQSGISALLHKAGVSEEQIEITAESKNSSDEHWEYLRGKIAEIVPQPLSHNSPEENHVTMTTEELEQIVLQLCEVAEELDQRSQLMSQREKEHFEASQSLLNSQELLSEQIDYLLNKAKDLESDNSHSQQRRTSA